VIRLDLVRQDLATLRDALRSERVDRLRTGEPALSPEERRWLRERIAMPLAEPTAEQTALWGDP